MSSKLSLINGYNIVEVEETIEQLLQHILFSRDFPEQQVTMKREETGLEITGFRLGVQGEKSDLMIPSKC